MTGNDRKILVWDVPTRLFHWLVVALVIAAYVTVELDWMDWHAWVGDSLLALLFFRVLWGVFGSDTDRFSRFVARPREMLRHLGKMLQPEPDRQVGHNPAGGWMVLLLIALLFGETLSGLYVANDVADEGPLTELVPAPIADAVTALHWIFWYALLACVTVHVLAVLVYLVAKKQNLVLPMITGRKTLPAGVPAPRIGSLARAAVLFCCGALAAAALATYL